LATLRPATELKWHRVAKVVNNSRNKSEECNKPIELAAKPEKPPMNKTMMAWLNVRKKREDKVKAEKSDPSDNEEQETEGDSKRRTSSDGSTVDSPAKRPRLMDIKRTALQQNGGSSDSEVKSAER